MPDYRNSETSSAVGINIASLTTSNLQHFIVPLMHTMLKNGGLLKHFKNKEAAPTCFGLQGNYHQGATAST